MPPQVAPMVSTGDVKIDEQIKALNKEMEEKIKAIRDDYLTRIKAIVGTRKVMMASTTPRGMMEGEKRGMNEGKKMGRPMMGTSTDGTMQPPMRRAEVRGVETENLNQVGNAFGPRIQNFLKGFFGGGE